MRISDWSSDVCSSDLWRLGGDAFGQSLALFRRKDGVAFEEGDRTRLATVLAGAAAFAGRRKSMGLDDGRPALALAHISAQRERLSEGKKRVGREAVGDHGVPEEIGRAHV